ncbi:sigma-54-dependent Fis family transcriptional regulator [Rhodoferax sp. OV413]|uniref:sigma-54-dependent Fis family transcriptional regulator n=1 Tax=Rhodoferax sp. OV413 TaxID=1855285 RepID=UPI0025F5EF0E|nr:sigma-54-dependent Fis family transcriptional regulator [Rhodoferax sp. OV413]
MTAVSIADAGGKGFAPLICPPLDSPEHTTLIHTSHGRSNGFGLREIDLPDYTSAARGEMNEALEANRFLYRHAAPIMETLYHQIATTQSMVLLTARSGMVLHSLGDADFLEKASRVALAPGVDWSEKSKGTNAIGTALAEEHPVVVHGAQHYLQVNRFLTCSCTPIFDPYGKVIGALDVTGDHRSYHQHTMALVRMSAQMIENHMFAAVFPKDVIVRFHSRAEFLGTLMEGIVVLTQEGRFVTANRSAQFQLGLSCNALGAHTFSSLFGTSISQFIDRIRTAGSQPVTLCMHNGVSVCCLSEQKPRNTFEAQGFEAPPAAAPVVEKQQARMESLSSLRYLDTGDPQLARVIQNLSKVRGCDIPIMILGETGTGKDLLAQAIHNDSPRARHNFVSVNCASIPETLIESELFGYEEGAFTGAKRKGSVGKVLYANGGTLFLDEIGDMPKHLQARLLRVLQERKVSPLGAGKEVEVDVAVICATNKNLKDMIARGEFREDLYYRLNGLVVRLPALRERQDLEVVTRKILASVCRTATPMGISAEVMDIFHQFPWPGNFRQLFNLLRTTVVMAGDSSEVQLHHLPQDFLEEANLADRMLPPSIVRHMPYPATALQARTDISIDVSAPPVPPQAMPLRTEPARLENVALDAMAQALRSTGGNVSVAAKMLGVSRNTIYRKKDQLPSDVWG